MFSIREFIHEEAKRENIKYHWSEPLYRESVVGGLGQIVDTGNQFVNSGAWYFYIFFLTGESLVNPTPPFILTDIYGRTIINFVGGGGGNQGTLNFYYCLKGERLILNLNNANIHINIGFQVAYSNKMTEQ